MLNWLNKKFVFAAVIILILIGVIFARPIYPHASPRVIQGVGVNLAQAVAVTEGLEIKTDIKNQKIDTSKLPDESTDAKNKALAQQADARKAANEPSEKDMPTSFIGHIIGIILYFILWVLSHLVVFAATLANAVLSINHFTDVPVVTLGWEITRGLCNMIFALVLLILAFDTVLQTEYMGARRTLVRLVVIALLINFSLMFGGIIIDFSQVLTQYFITAAAGTNGDVGLKLAGALNLSKVYQTPQDQSAYQKLKEFVLGPPLSMIVTLLMSCIVLLVAVFTFFAFSFFLLVRVVWLWLLLILAPLAWASYVAPNLASSFGGGWERWWKEFLKWAFFAPAYAFFLYLALTIAQNGLGFTTPLINKAGDSAILAGFFKSFDIIIQYIVVIAILLAGLQFAQKAGVYGASAVMSSVKKMGNKVGDWGKMQAKRPGYYAFDKTYAGLASGTGKLMNKIGDKTGLRVFKNTAGLLSAKSRQISMAAGEREHKKKFERLIPHMTTEAIQGLLGSATGIRALKLAQTAKARGDLTKDYIKNDKYYEDHPEEREKDEMSQERCRTAAKKSADVLRRFNFNKDADDLEEQRLDIVSEKNLPGRLKDSLVSGNFPKGKGYNFRGKEGALVVAKLGAMLENKEIEREDIATGFMRSYKPSQDEFQKTSEMIMAGDEKFELQKSVREMYAATVRDVNTAFSNSQGINKKLRKEYNDSLTPREIASLSAKTPAGQNSLIAFGEDTTPVQIHGIRNELSGSQKGFVLQGIMKTDNANIQNHINNSPAWAKDYLKAMKEQTEAIKHLTKANERQTRAENIIMPSSPRTYMGPRPKELPKEPPTSV